MHSLFGIFFVRKFLSAWLLKQIKIFVQKRTDTKEKPVQVGKNLRKMYAVQIHLKPFDCKADALPICHGLCEVFWMYVMHCLIAA